MLALVAAVWLVALPTAAQYNYFPGEAAVDDGRTVALAGDAIETLAQDVLTFIVAVPPGETQFELGIFDGETGGTDGGGLRHWDNGTTQLQYALYYDPYMQGTSDPANLVGMWRGNEVNPTSGAAWTASGATFPDNGWWNLTVDVPEPPEPLPGQAPSGATFYHLCVSYRGQTGGGVTDPCTGDARPADASPSTIANFKIRATANIAVLSFAFAYEGALRFSNADGAVIYPEWDGVFPGLGDTFWLTTPTTYDGEWSFAIDVPASQESLTLFGGDFDFGTAANLEALPSQVMIEPCADSDDPDTSNAADFPPFAVDSGGVRVDDSLPEGERAAGGVPADDSRFDPFRRSPCIHWTLTSPGADGDLGTAADNVTYVNANPSSQREWEQFRISSEATCDASATCDPLTADCADFCEAAPLPAGIWRLDIHGVDLSNLNAWRSTQVSGFCINCGVLPRPYVIGDTVFEDVNGNGLQDPGEAGIPGVLVELVDSAGQVIDTRLTGDPGSYGAGEWAACMARNTGVDTPVDSDGLYCFDVSVPNLDPEGVDSLSYTVRVADANFSPGGALYDHFGAEPVATLPSPQQSDVVSEGGGNVMTYDFGYRVVDCAPCEGKVSLLHFAYHGDEEVYVKVKGKKGHKTEYLFHGSVSPGEVFAVEGSWSSRFKGTVGTEITLYVNHHEVATIHTSCSQPIGPGQVYGDFEIVYGESKKGGALCPVDDCDDGGDDDGPGTGTIGYWKTHPHAWPLDALQIGAHTYPKMTLLWALGQPVHGDVTKALAQQLIAAKLNVALGNVSTCIDATIMAADAFLAEHPWGSGPRGAARDEGEALKDLLDDYNNGRLCAPHRG